MNIHRLNQKKEKKLNTQKRLHFQLKDGAVGGAAFSLLLYWTRVDRIARLVYKHLGPAYCLLYQTVAEHLI